MGFLDYFRNVSTMSVEKARALFERSDPESLQILDVRGEDEYRQGHLPGALLFPIENLQERCGDLDPNKRTLVY